MNREALMGWFMKLYPELRTRLRGRLRSQDLADEALNETWLRLAKGGELGAIKDAKAYLSRMAMNIAIDRKRAGARLASAVDIDALLALPDTEPGPEQAAAARLELRALEKAVAGLSARRRAILIAARLEGRSCGDIAHAMSLSKRTVEMELRHALDHCADHLASRERIDFVNPGAARLDKRMVASIDDGR